MKTDVNNSPSPLKLIVAAVQKLSLARNLDSVMNIVKTTARELTNADGATFILKDGTECYYVDEDAISPLWKGQHFPMEACISGWAMINKQSVVIEDIYIDERIPKDAYKPTFVKSLAMVPIRIIDPIGAIGIYWAKNYLPTNDELELLQSLADITAVTIENVQVYAELENRVNERTAELVAANKELESFSYSVSHDLRAPLRAINGYLNILSEDYVSKLDDEAKRLIGNATTNAGKMNELIDGLLQFSRMGKKELVKTNVSAKNIVNEICKTMKDSEAGRDIEITINDLENTEADETLIRQVWTNYISNAVKFTQHKGNTKIEIGCTEESGFCVYYVKDNGAGFDMQYYSKLFGVFQRLHSQEEFKGTGVGLAVVQRIILKHGGKVWAEGKPNEGSTFYFSLPKQFSNAPLI